MRKGLMRRLAFIQTLALFLAPAAAHADADWFGRDTVQGLVQVQAGAFDGVASWTRGGFGKTVFGGGSSLLATGEAVWRPDLSDAVSLVVDAVAQPRFGPELGLGEGYILYKPIPTSALRIQGRAGLLYAPLSLEHDSAPGEPWSVQDVITPSAINSWAGEELKTLGIEGQVKRVSDTATIGLTLGLFGDNDTSGTLLALRGWSFSNLVSTSSSRLRLPPLSDYVDPVQADRTKPVTSVDGRIGGYVKAEASDRSGASLNGFYYDNNADLGSENHGQWAWRTRFVGLGAVYPIAPFAILNGQVVDGRTKARLGETDGYPFDVAFKAAYVKLTVAAGAEKFSTRIDAFETRSPHPGVGSVNYQPGPLDPDETYSETGWSGLAAWMHPLTAQQSLIFEVLQVNWKRDYLADFGEAPKQSSTTVQAAYRHTF